MIWGVDIAADNARFLEHIDANLYYRIAQMIVSGPGEDGADDDKTRKDDSSLARMLWHHGVETLVMMLGAYIQAPDAAHAYFLKCKTEQAIKIGEMLLVETKPRYNRLNQGPFTLSALLNQIHQSVVWKERDISIERFENALRKMLAEFTSEQHRWEYNSIKHGLRASHGSFGLAVGVEHIFGVAPPDEEMQMVGYSRDASFFNVARPLHFATDQQSRVNFQTEMVSVSWSLEKVICELQILSLLLHNTVSALRIAGGAKAGTITFNKVANGEAFWAQYLSLQSGSIPTASMRAEINARQLQLGTDKQVFDSYRQPPSGSKG
jgi:hypothetical protein